MTLIESIDGNIATKSSLLTKYKSFITTIPVHRYRYTVLKLNIFVDAISS